MFKKGTPWNNALNPKMKQFEKETKKNAIHNGKITGQFEDWYNKQNKPKTITYSDINLKTPEIVLINIKQVEGKYGKKFKFGVWMNGVQIVLEMSRYVDSIKELKKLMEYEINKEVSEKVFGSNAFS